MRHHFDTKQLQSLRRLYTSTQCDKDLAIDKIIKHWSPDAAKRLNLDKYSDLGLCLSVKVAQLVGIDKANVLLGLIALRRLRLGKRGRVSVREITTSDWQDLAVALASKEAKNKVFQIPALTNNKQNWFGITKPLTIFGERVPAASFSYGCCRFWESHNVPAEIGLRNTIETVKRARVNQR